MLSSRRRRREGQLVGLRVAPWCSAKYSASSTAWRGPERLRWRASMPTRHNPAPAGGAPGAQHHRAAPPRLGPVSPAHLEYPRVDHGGGTKVADGGAVGTQGETHPGQHHQRTDRDHPPWRGEQPGPQIEVFQDPVGRGEPQRGLVLSQGGELGAAPLGSGLGIPVQHDDVTAGFCGRVSTAGSSGPR